MKASLVVFILAAALALPSRAADLVEGRVVSIADGDTLTVLDAGLRQHRIRLAEIDAPEKRQAFGQVARQGLAALCFGKPARVVVQDIDRYGRQVGRVYCAGVDANAAQVRSGLAWVYRRYARDAALLPLEASARAQRVGLWRDASPQPPWTFRQEARR